jgi:hypothetical protein
MTFGQAVLYGFRSAAGAADGSRGSEAPQARQMGRGSEAPQARQMGRGSEAPQAR